MSHKRCGVKANKKWKIPFCIQSITFPYSCWSATNDMLYRVRVGALTKLVTIVGWFAGCRNWPQLEMLSQFEILLKCLGNCVVQLKQGAHNSEDVQTIGKQCFKGFKSFYVQFVRRPTGGRFFVYYFTFCNTKLPFWKANLNQFRHAKNTV